MCVKRHAIDRKIEKDVLLHSPQDISEFSTAVLEWYAHSGRRFPWRNKSVSLYQKVIAEVLLQRTRAEVVASFFPKFVRRFPSWRELATATEKDLREFIYPLGLWKQKASTIKSLATEMALRKGRFPRVYGEIRGLPGIGQYIGNAISVFFLQQPRPLLDVNMARVLERYFGPRKLADIRDDPYLQALASLVVINSASFIDINYAILDLAATVCKKTPLCNNCPLYTKCRFVVKSSRTHITSSSDTA